MKGQGHRGQRSNLCFFLFVPLLLRSLGRSSPNLVGRLRAAPDISSRGSFIKGQGHRGQRSNFCISQVLGPNFTKLGGMVEGGPGYWLEGFIFKRSRSSRSKVKFMFLSVCSPTSQVLGPVFTKLGGNVEGGPRYKLEGFIFLRSRSLRSKVLGPIFTKLGGMVEGSPGY